MGLIWTDFFQCFETRRSLDKCCDYVPPTDAQRLWGWMGEWAGLDSGLLRDDWRVCRKTASPFDWQRFCTIKSCWCWSYSSTVPSRILQVYSKDKLLQPISWYLLGGIASQFSSYISHNYTLHSLFQFNLISTFPLSSLISFLDSLFIHSYSRLEHFLE